MNNILDNFISYCDKMSIVLETEDYNTKLNRKDIIKYLKQFSSKYPKKDWYVSFKAALVLYGIETESNDIDLYGTPRLCNQFIRKGFHNVPAPYGGCRITINDRVEIFDDVNFDSTELINVEGFNVATLDDIERFYQKMNRPKDQETLRKIREYKNGNGLATEACKSIDEARKFVYEVGKLAKKYDANYFIVTDGASGTNNNGNLAVKHARDMHVQWEKQNGGDPDEDWKSLFNPTLQKIIEFNQKLNNMEYIICTADGRVITRLTSDDFINHYRLLPPSEFEKRNGGVCWDYVVYEAWYFKKYFPKVKFKTFFNVFYDGETDPSHSFLLFTLEDRVFWFESSWKSCAGIYEFKSENEALSYIINKLRVGGNIKPNIRNYLVQYNAMDKSMYNMTCEEYMDYMDDLIKKGEYRYKKAKSQPIQTYIGSTPNHQSYTNMIANESLIFNEKDIYYNKDKFDSGEINLCFITGHSGSGKSTMGKNMSGKRIEHYCLDDLNQNYAFTDENLKEYGDLIYSFFKGVGKKYRYYSYKDLQNCTNPLDDSGDKFDECVNRDFVKYAINYAKSHRDTKFVIEGIWIFLFFKPQEFKDYAFYIKGTSRIISDIRAAKRDSTSDFPNKQDRFKKAKAYIGRVRKFFTKEARISEATIGMYRKYFLKLMEK